jgi:exonuclease III
LNCIANIWRLDSYALAIIIKSIDNFLIIGLYNPNKDVKILSSIEQKIISFITPLAHKAKEKKWKVIISGDFNSTYQENATSAYHTRKKKLMRSPIHNCLLRLKLFDFY